MINKSRQRFLELINEHLGLDEPLAIELDRRICEEIVDAFEEFQHVMKEHHDGPGGGRSSWHLCYIEDEEGEPICEKAKSFDELCKRLTGNTDQQGGVALFETVGDYLFEEIENLIIEYVTMVTACEGERFDDDHAFCFSSDLVGKYFSEFGPLSCEEFRLRCGLFE